MGVTLTEKAAGEVKKIMTEQNLPEGSGASRWRAGGRMQRLCLQPELRHQLPANVTG